MRKLSAIIITSLILLMGSAPVSALSNSGQTLFAATCSASTSKCAACSGLDVLGDSSQNCSSNGSAVNSLVNTVVNIFSYVVGIVAVIVIIVSGLKFITAGGEANKVAEAKKGLIYALGGLVLVALAQIIVRWVLGTSSQVGAMLVWLR